jgi:hypothetical protein
MTNLRLKIVFGDLRKLCMICKGDLKIIFKENKFLGRSLRIHGAIYFFKKNFL